jgi:hypothetical protein
MSYYRAIESQDTSYGLRAPREHCAWKKQSGLAPIRAATKHRARASLSGGDERGRKLLGWSIIASCPQAKLTNASLDRP